jgi:hypothetical protein
MVMVLQILEGALGQSVTAAGDDRRVADQTKVQPEVGQALGLERPRNVGRGAEGGVLPSAGGVGVIEDLDGLFELLGALDERNGAVVGEEPVPGPTRGAVGLDELVGAVAEGAVAGERAGVVVGDAVVAESVDVEGIEPKRLTV